MFSKSQSVQLFFWLNHIFKNRRNQQLLAKCLTYNRTP